jgi:hypothetical protein
MRWLAIGLASVSGLLTMVAVMAGLLGIMPARGGESLFGFAGVTLTLALASAVLATALAGLDLRRSRHKTSAAIALVLGIAALLASGTIVLFVATLEGAQKLDDAKTVASKARHERALSPAERRAAHKTTSDALVAEWAADHDAADARHKDEAIELTWFVGGTDWLDGVQCMFLYGHGDVLCCLAAGTAAPSQGATTFVGRYGGTDRRFSGRGRNEGKLVFDGCEPKSAASATTADASP